ncbi:MAG: T9SS type A sorting domain-containing protein [Bacteroidales bacterium]|jgi:hypothetical protein|nr:T9SS type A sorting domain-containing protein [Bacteroidales bacterium]
MKKILFILVTIAFTIPVKAQWSTDPTENNQIVFENTYDWESHLLSDGSFVVYYNRPDGYRPTGLGDSASFLKHVLKRYNADGTLIWEKTVASTPNKTFTVVNEYVFIDGNDNILICVADARYDTFGILYPSGLYKWWHPNLSIYKISKDGDYLWGENGVSIDKTPHHGIAQTNVIALENGSVVVSYSQDAQNGVYSGPVTTKIVCLDAETGEIKWKKDLMVNSSNVSSGAKLINGGNDEFIAVYNSIAVQKLDFNGDEVWPHTVVYDKGGFPSGPLPYTVIKTIPVKRGVFISWYADPDGDNFEDVFCSYVDMNGNLVFSTGTAGTKLGYQEYSRKFSPVGIYDAVNEFVYYEWREDNSTQSWHRIVGQKISLTGELVWDANGVETGAMLQRSAGYPAIGLDDEGNPVFLYLEQTNGQKDYAGYAQKRTPAGDSLWTVTFTNTVGDSEHIYDKSNLKVLPFSQNQWIALWNDNRPEAADLLNYDHVWGQNITKDGNIGTTITSIEAPVKANMGNAHFFVANNPVAGETSFTIKGLKEQKVEISILNGFGKTVATVFKGAVLNDENTVAWNPGTLAKGIYVATLRTQAGVEAIKLVIK